MGRNIYEPLDDVLVNCDSDGSDPDEVGPTLLAFLENVANMSDPPTGQDFAEVSLSPILIFSLA